MGAERDDQTGIQLPFRPLFVELSETQLAAIQEAQEGEDEEAAVTAVVEQLHRDGNAHLLSYQMRLVRAWASESYRDASGQPLSPRMLTRLHAWLRVLERDEEVNGWGSAWTRRIDGVDLWPTMMDSYMNADRLPWDVLT